MDVRSILINNLNQHLFWLFPGSFKSFGVESWPVFEANGVIHVWHHAEGESPSWYPPEYQQIADGQYKYRGRTEHVVAAHIQVGRQDGAAMQRGIVSS